MEIVTTSVDCSAGTLVFKILHRMIKTRLNYVTVLRGE